jgi:hypothetical protein
MRSLRQASTTICPSANRSIPIVQDTTRATAAPARPLTDTVAVEPGKSWRLSWGAILAGAIIVLAVQLLLSLLGAGIGLSMIDPAQGGTPTAQSFGLGAGIWWVLSYVLALVAGGYVAARLAASTVPLDGMLQGIVTWAVALMVTAYLLTSAVGGIIGGAFGVVGSTLSASGETIKNAAPQVAQAAGVSPDLLQERTRNLLRASPGPVDPAKLDPQQAEQEIVALLPQLTMGGEQAAGARDRITAIMAARLGITKAEADTRLGQTQAEIDQAKVQAADAAVRATDATTSGLSWASLLAFFALALGAAAAAFGGHAATQPRYAHILRRPAAAH